MIKKFPNKTIFRRSKEKSHFEQNRGFIIHTSNN